MQGKTCAAFFNKNDKDAKKKESEHPKDGHSRGRPLLFPFTEEKKTRGLTPIIPPVAATRNRKFGYQ